MKMLWWLGLIRMHKEKSCQLISAKKMNFFCNPQLHYRSYYSYSATVDAIQCSTKQAMFGFAGWKYFFLLFEPVHVMRTWERGYALILGGKRLGVMSPGTSWPQDRDRQTEREWNKGNHLQAEYTHLYWAHFLFTITSNSVSHKLHAQLLA